MAEGEVGAGDDGGSAIVLREPGDELLRRQRAERHVEADHQRGVGPGSGEEAQALLDRGEQEGGHVGAEEMARMRIEGRDDRRTPFLPRPCDGAPDHRLMAGVETVEIAEGDHPAAKRRRERCLASQSLHGAPIGSARASANGPARQRAYRGGGAMP